MGQDNITIDRTYFKLPVDNNSDSSSNYMDFTSREQLSQYLNMMSLIQKMQEKLKQEEKSSPVEDEELDEDIEDNVQNEDEPSGEGSWQSGNKSLENVPSERFSVGKKLRNFFS